MSYLDKLEELRQKEGKGAVNEHLLRNKIAYSLKKAANKAAARALIEVYEHNNMF